MTDTNDTKETKKKSSCNTRERGRCWCFTLNNYETQDIKMLVQMLETFVFQEETGENGTRHLQGVMKFKNPRSFGAIKKIVPKAHIEKCRNWKASTLYCSKEATRTGKLYVSDDMTHLTQRHTDVDITKKYSILEVSEMTKNNLMKELLNDEEWIKSLNESIRKRHWFGN